MPRIVFANKQSETPKPVTRVISAPPPPNITKVVSAQPPANVIKSKTPPPPPPSPNNVIRAGAASKPVTANQLESSSETVSKPNNEPYEQPQQMVEAEIEINKNPDKHRIYAPEPTSTIDDDDWGIMQVTKKKSAKEISRTVQQNIQKSSGKMIVLDAAGVNLLVETIVAELSKQFVRRDEIVDVVTKALQKMVMEDVKPK